MARSKQVAAVLHAVMDTLDEDDEKLQEMLVVNRLRCPSSIYVGPLAAVTMHR